MPERIVEKWKDYYINRARLTLGRTESNSNQSAFLSTTFTLDEMYNVFDFETWLLPLVQEHNPAIKTKHLVRAHLNVNTQLDHMTGHVDITDEKFFNDAFYLSVVVFLNPCVDQHIGNGLIVGDKIVENKFNRVVMFDGRTWHKAVPPTDNFVRLTGYFSFSNIKLREKFSQTKNVWQR